jgi:hypothetical protein
MQTREHFEQCALIDWAQINKQRYPWLAYLIAIPNGGERHPAVAGKLRAEGVKAGVSDLFLAFPVGKYHGAWIEMKAPKDASQRRQHKPTPLQREWLDKMTALGYAAVCCQGWDQARAFLLAYGRDEWNDNFSLSDF